MKPLEAVAKLFHFNHQFLDSVTTDFSDADWLAPPGTKGGNHAHWILGHLAVSRRALLRGVGKPVPPEPWEKAFGRGSQPVAGKDGPSPAALRQDFLASGALLHDHLASLSPEEAAAPYGRKLPDGSESVSGAAHFLFLHECYHIGQLGLLRRILGKPGVA